MSWQPKGIAAAPWPSRNMAVVTRARADSGVASPLARARLAADRDVMLIAFATAASILALLKP